MSSATPPTVLVTGATGFVAGHVIADLLHHGYAVRGTVRNSSRADQLTHLVALAESLGGQLDFVAAHLDDDTGWGEAVEGCAYVLHTASPNPPAIPADENELVRPAVEGTLRVLRAASASASVRRVVLTSSTSAIVAGHPRPNSGPYREDDWSVLERSSAYEKSKTLAERAAWDFVAGLPAQRDLELVVLNPGLVLGPLQRPEISASMQIIERLLNRRMPAVPRLAFSPVDVRDVAAGHRLALEGPAAAGNRFILAGPGVWMGDVARLLASEFASRGFTVPTRPLPYPALWVAARFDPALKLVLPLVGVPESVSNEKARLELRWNPRPLEETMRDAGQSLIDFDLARPRVTSR